MIIFILSTHVSSQLAKIAPRINLIGYDIASAQNRGKDFFS